MIVKQVKKKRETGDESHVDLRTVQQIVGMRCEA